MWLYPHITVPACSENECTCVCHLWVEGDKGSTSPFPDSSWMKELSQVVGPGLLPMCPFLLGVNRLVSFAVGLCMVSSLVSLLSFVGLLHDSTRVYRHKVTFMHTA